MSQKFNYQLLIIGRFSRGVSQKELAKKADIEQSYLSKIENGLREPSTEVIERLGEALFFPPSFFMQMDQAYGLPLSVHAMFRRKASVGKRKLERIRAELNIRLFHVKRLLNSIELSQELPMPEIDPDEYRGDIDEIAATVRRAWLIPPGPIENLTEYVERAGGIVVFCDFSDTPISGVTMKVQGLPPCIFLNKSDPADRLRLTLAHELGHIIMHQVPSPNMEDQAFRFASAFLMPANEIKGKLSGQLTITRLAYQKKYWKISMQGLLHWAKEIEAITNNHARYLWMQINKMNLRLKEPPELDFPKETPKLLQKILELHFAELDYSTSDLSRLLHIHEDELSDLYFLDELKFHVPPDPTKRKLRLVSSK